ncbi:hypothetical protein RhiirA1_398380 [Rhizophagus irregularis]|uniref:Uncharacterized protein n=1 Tax=Rhizophagus irregularis TaxID=588596 RepID=A0A2N0RDW6_9GLOM|nr:hypothetical protein RhiirA1_398380 [Rhizophagus irregularis]
MFKTEGESSTKPLQKQGKKGGSEERSWIWNYYEKLVAKSPYIRTVKYQVEIYGKKGLQPYGKIMNSKDYSTSNYIAHLNTAHDKQAKKDGKQLKGINFTKDEWNAISELIPILELFANATELLGGVKLSNSNSNEVEVVDFTEPNTTFDDDVEYEDSEDGDIANNQSKQQKTEELRSC